MLTWRTKSDSGAPAVEDYARLGIMRIVWTILLGALVTLLFGAVVVRDRAKLGRRKMGRLLTVEEAVRWRPE